LSATSRSFPSDNDQARLPQIDQSDNRNSPPFSVDIRQVAAQTRRGGGGPTFPPTVILGPPPRLRRVVRQSIRNIERGPRVRADDGSTIPARGRPPPGTDGNQSEGCQSFVAISVRETGGVAFGDDANGASLPKNKECTIEFSRDDADIIVLLARWVGGINAPQPF